MVVYGNQIAMEPTLELSLARIFGARIRGEETAPGTPAPAPTSPGPADGRLPGLIQQAWDAWQKAQEALRRGDWSTYGQEQKRLEDTLRQLRDTSARAK